MEKLALIFWSLVPRKIEHSTIISGSRAIKIKFVWFGKPITASVKIENIF